MIPNNVPGVNARSRRTGGGSNLNPYQSQLPFQMPPGWGRPPVPMGPVQNQGPGQLFFPMIGAMGNMGGPNSGVKSQSSMGNMGRPNLPRPSPLMSRQSPFNPYQTR